MELLELHHPQRFLDKALFLPERCIYLARLLPSDQRPLVRRTWNEFEGMHLNVGCLQIKEPARAMVQKAHWMVNN